MNAPRSFVRASGEQPHIHFIGIGGIHMSGLARILLEEGCRVSGSDLVASQLTQGLADSGVRISIGHESGNVEGATLVVRTAAVKDANPEAQAARRAGIELITRAEMVARIAGDRPTLTVAGTHGKTTTATMLTLILREAGLDPTYLLGGESDALGGQAGRGSGAQVVLEADEYARAFHEYRPTIAVITNIDRDHLDYYGTDAALQEAFLGYGRMIRPGAALIVGADSPQAMAVGERLEGERSDISVMTFGTAVRWTWGAREIAASESETHFQLTREGTDLGEVALQVPGAFNVRNAVAAVAAGVLGGASMAAAQHALARFRGVHRRFEHVGGGGGVTLVDDYAHHPTEIAATVEAARQRYPSRRLIVLFQPHTYSRSSYLREGFQRCFGGVDRLYLMETYAAREEPDAGLSAAELSQQIREPRAEYAGSADEAVETVGAALRPGDVLITMGAGDVNEAGPPILKRLEAR